MALTTQIRRTFRVPANSFVPSEGGGADDTPVWDTVIADIDIYEGVAFSFDLDEVCTGAEEYEVYSGTLPTGLTLTGETGVVAGTPGTPPGSEETAVDVEFEATSMTADIDWAARSANADMATRFETNGEVVDYRLLDSKAANITRSTSRTFYGQGSLKFDILDADGANSGNWFRHLKDSWGLYTGSGGQSGGAGNSTNQGYDPPDVIEVAYCMYVPASLRNNSFPGGGGWKTSIISHDSGSNQSFEIVLSALGHRGYPMGYYRNIFIGWETALSTACSGSDFKHQPSIDRGANPLTGLNPDTGLAWSGCEQARARYGGLYSYGQSGYPDSPVGNLWKFWEQLGTPTNPIGPELFPADDWMGIKHRVTLNSYSAATNRIQVYTQRRWQTDWQMIVDLQNISLPNEASGYGYNTRFNTLWLLPYNTGRSGGGGITTFIQYDGIIVKSGGAVIAPMAYWPDPE